MRFIEKNWHPSSEGSGDPRLGAWIRVFRGTVREFFTDELSDRAAGLTYYGVLSLFPALLLLVSLIGLMGQDTSHRLIDDLGNVAPGTVQQILNTAITELQHGQGTAGVVAGISLAGALWSASGYLGGFMRASNAIYDVPEGRPAWKTLPIRVGVTALMMVLLSASAIGVVLSGDLAYRVGDLIGVSATAVAVWNIVKWPLLLAIVALMIAILYWASPNVKHDFRWITPGGLLAIGLWALASAGFTLYVAHFSSYNRVYGSLASVIIFLVWLWISNLAILFGAELNAELERSRAVAAGLPQDTEPYVELREAPKRTPTDASPRDDTRRAGPPPSKSDRKHPQGW